MINNRKYIEGLIISDSLYNFKNNVTLTNRELFQYIYDYTFYISELKKKQFFNDAIKLHNFLRVALMMYGLEEKIADNLLTFYTKKHYEG